MAEYVPLQNVENDEFEISAAAATNNEFNSDTPRWALDPEKQPTSRRALWKQHLSSALITALPRYIRPGGLRHRDIGPTSYLDALRGYAAFNVFIFHIFGTDHQNDWQHQPILNLLFAGRGMVALFFVISGYALGNRLLILTRQGDTERLLNALASSTFRRYFRLYLSSVVACMIALVLVRLRFWNGMQGGCWRDGLFAQIVDFLGDMRTFVNPIPRYMTGRVDDNFFHTKYLSQLWTIPVEYRGSIALFVFVLATCKMSTRNRMISTWVMIVGFYTWEDVYAAEFLAGLFIADLALSRHPERWDKQTLTAATPAREESALLSLSRSTLAKIGYSCLLFTGLFLLAQPQRGDNLGVLGSFPWGFLHRIRPWWWDGNAWSLFWLGFGAFATVLALDSWPTLQKPFHWRVSQYLGDLSFGLYAMHPCFGYGMKNLVGEPFRKKYLGNSNSWWAYIPEVLMIFVVVFTAADYFERIDRKCVAFARWLQQKLFR
ncbi:hypothetical protein LTS15_005582 [Exophiala xenobiotica]|nr:hypothetical protein LTS15_005582 [Exophiala xenobiotica]